MLAVLIHLHHSWWPVQHLASHYSVQDAYSCYINHNIIEVKVKYGRLKLPQFHLEVCFSLSARALFNYWCCGLLLIAVMQNLRSFRSPIYFYENASQYSEACWHSLLWLLHKIMSEQVGGACAPHRGVRTLCLGFQCGTRRRVLIGCSHVVLWFPLGKDLYHLSQGSLCSCELCIFFFEG